MTANGTNAAGKAVYTYDVPKETEYVIFTNGTEQTEKIPFDGAEHSYIALEAVNEKGRHLYEIS